MNIPAAVMSGLRVPSVLGPSELKGAIPSCSVSEPPKSSLITKDTLGAYAATVIAPSAEPGEPNIY